VGYHRKDNLTSLSSIKKRNILTLDRNGYGGAKPETKAKRTLRCREI